MNLEFDLALGAAIAAFLLVFFLVALLAPDRF
jgi:K+-transporting ATPase KdpF subunit